MSTEPTSTLETVAALCRADMEPAPDRTRLNDGHYPRTRPAGPTSQTGIYLRSHVHDWVENGALINGGLNPGWNPTFECWCGSVIVDLHVDARTPVRSDEVDR